MENMLTTKELAERWGVTEAHLANMRSLNKGVPYVTMRRKVFYKIEDVEAFEKPEYHQPSPS